MARTTLKPGGKAFLRKLLPVAVALLGISLLTFQSFRSWADDECRFPGIDKYEGLQRAAHDRAQKEKESLDRAIAAKNTGLVSNILFGQLARLTDAAKETRPLYYRIAAFHAVMIANHMDFASSSPEGPDAFKSLMEKRNLWLRLGRPVTSAWAVRLVYRLNLLSHGQLSGLFGTGSVIASFYVYDAPPPQTTSRQGTLGLTTLLPSFPKDNPKPPMGLHRCPPVPSEEWESDFMGRVRM